MAFAGIDVQLKVGSSFKHVDIRAILHHVHVKRQTAGKETGIKYFAVMRDKTVYHSLSSLKDRERGVSQENGLMWSLICSKI